MFLLPSRQGTSGIVFTPVSIRLIPTVPGLKEKEIQQHWCGLQGRRFSCNSCHQTTHTYTVQTLGHRRISDSPGISSPAGPGCPSSQERQPLLGSSQWKYSPLPLKRERHMIRPPIQYWLIIRQITASPEDWFSLSWCHSQICCRKNKSTIIKITEKHNWDYTRTALFFVYI